MPTCQVSPVAVVPPATLIIAYDLHAWRVEHPRTQEADPIRTSKGDTEANQLEQNWRAELVKSRGAATAKPKQTTTSSLCMGHLRLQAPTLRFGEFWFI